MRRLTVWKDEVFRALSKNATDKQPHPGVCRFLQWQTTESTCGNLSRCFLYLSVKDFFLASSSSCFFFVSLSSMSTTDHNLCIRKVLCNCIWRGVGILPVNSDVDAFLLCFFESEACSISFCSLGCSLVEFLIYQSNCVSGRDAFDKEELQCNNYKYWM